MHICYIFDYMITRMGYSEGYGGGGGHSGGGGGGECGGCGGVESSYDR